MSRATKAAPTQGQSRMLTDLWSREGTYPPQNIVGAMRRQRQLAEVNGIEPADELRDKEGRREVRTSLPGRGR